MVVYLAREIGHLATLILSASFTDRLNKYMAWGVKRFAFKRGVIWQILRVAQKCSAG